MAGTALGTALAVGLAALRGAPHERLAETATPSAPLAHEPVGVAAPVVVVPTTTTTDAVATTTISAPATSSLDPTVGAASIAERPHQPGPESSAEERAKPPRPPRSVRSREAAAPRVTEPGSTAPATHAGAPPAPTKAQLAHRIAQLRLLQPALATSLTVELNELDAEDEASLRSLASRIAAAGR